MAVVLSVAGLLLSTADAAQFTASIDVANVTGNVSKWIFGMNMYQGYGLNNEYTGNYTIGRLGGNAQTRFNYSINAANSGNDYYFINQGSDFSWQDFYAKAHESGLAMWTQIPAMGWVSGSTTKSWSFSQSKYGAQKSNECTNQPSGCTWCAQDAGNGVWANGSMVVGNNPYDTSIKTDVYGAAGFVEAVLAAYPDSAPVFSIDNEPTLWSSNHRDVHPEGATYDEIVNDTLVYGAAIKKVCNGSCLVAGYSPWGWCGYFEDGADHDAGFCTGGGPDFVAKGNTPLAAYYLQQTAQYEKEHGQRVLDILDIHYYPAADGASMNCDETDSTKVANRLQAPRSLYDPSYKDPSWINTVISLIPRFQAWIDELYPGTKFSISEYNFGGDDCITSTMAHSEALAVMATYGVFAATRWSKPLPGAMVSNAYNIFTNYDGKGANVYDCEPYAVNVKDSNVEMLSSYAFVAKDRSKMFVVAYNKDESNTNELAVSLMNSGDLAINGAIAQYGVDKGGLRYIGNIQADGNGFTVALSPWSIQLAVVPLQ